MPLPDPPISESISIHAPLTGSDIHFLAVFQLLEISIHAPLTGSDSLFWGIPQKKSQFQSTLPLRGATPAMDSGLVLADISIHAPLTGSDMEETYKENPR